MKQHPQDSEKVRLDKWLWAARFFKTRSIAKDAIEGGKVHFNGQRCKPGKIVEVGAKLTVRQGWDEKEILIVAVSDKRRGAPEAALLYQETEASVAKREAAVLLRKHSQAANMPPARRPNKKQRRQIHQFQVKQSDAE